MKISRIQRAYIITVIIMAVGAIFLSIMVFKNSDELDLPSFTVSLLSLAIALLAFMISLQTFISIDSVNKVTKMEGNILENQDYIISIPEIINTYSQPKANKTMDCIFETLIDKFEKKSKTAVEFADNLQSYVDLLVFFPALLSSTEIDQKKYEFKLIQLKKVIDERRAELHAINIGNIQLINETIKLIDYILDYQKVVKTNDFSDQIHLLSVRGSMFKNPVTKTIYYNYLGLMYNKKAMFKIQEKLGMRKEDLLDIDNLKHLMVFKYRINEADKELIKMFLQEAKTSFQKAIDASQDEEMWKGFIYYNQARTTFFLDCVTDNKEKNWRVLLKQAIYIRTKINILIEQSTHYQDTYLIQYFKFQEELVRLVSINLSLAEMETGKITHSNIEYRGNNILEMSEKVLLAIFQQNSQHSKLKHYQNKILERLESRRDR